MVYIYTYFFFKIFILNFSHNTHCLIVNDLCVLLQVQDPYKASYGVEDPEFAVTQLAQTTMRSELGKISLDSVFKERESLNITIVEAINKASASWGIDCLRYEIRDIKLVY